jgi:hypothetical protein
MERLISAGIVYLILIATALVIKPSFMFAEDGTWKEFGIGRNPRTHTWMPFWLFAILSALISYIFMTLIIAYRDSHSGTPLPENIVLTNKRRSSTPVLDEVMDVDVDDFEAPKPAPTGQPSQPRGRRGRGVPLDLPDGYYILNSKATEAAGGVPKYVYLGKGLE